MTTLLHLVADDFVSGQPLQSRVGIYAASAFAATPAETGFRDSVRSSYAMRKSIPLGHESPLVSPGDPITALQVVNVAANSLFPATGQRRIYEMIVRATPDTPQPAVILDFRSQDLARGLTLAIDAGNAYGANLAVDAYDNSSLLDSTITAVYAPAIDRLYHYWTLVLDFSSTRTFSVYDGATLVKTHAIPFAIDQVADDGAFMLLWSDDRSIDFVELMVHDVALTNAQMKYRSLHLRSFG